MAAGSKALASMLEKAAPLEDDADDAPEADAYGTEDCARRLCAAMGVDESKAAEVASILSEFIEAHMGEDE